ncbi:uncharacterized protein LOC117119038 [Anneissia japonica]|uniref:uncharacterized protein LOC117119038 n=1 Tax=Anneissia japonica TaxID=1529436 RepID=UPI00142577C3|nr:uncharacterized protein LOC117119038 [Anneissia japonica]
MVLTKVCQNVLLLSTPLRSLRLNLGSLALVSGKLLCGGLTLLVFASGIFDECSKLKVRCDQVSDRTKIITEDEAFHLKEEAVPLRPTESSPNRQPNLLSRMSLCFAISRNFVQLLSTAQPKKNIQCLNGIRVLSMFWVIFGHTSSFLFTSRIVGSGPRMGQ